jgi:amylosucrase
VQNVHVMRPEIRAEYERALGRVRGDTAFLLRLERFFTELRDPLARLYGHDPRLPAAWDRLLEPSRPPPPAAIPSCARSTTSAS